MKIDTRALIFGGIVVGAIVVIAGIAWGISFFTKPSDAKPQTSITDFFSALFPFGQNAQNPGGAGGSQNGTGGVSGDAPTLREISHNPVGGGHFQKNGMVRYVERETGHVFETAPQSLSVTRISNTTLPRIQNAVWLNDSTFILQYLDEGGATKNYAATLASSTPDQTLLGKFLSDFTDAFPAGGDKTFFEGVRASAGLVVYKTDTEEKSRTTVFISPIRSWTLLPAGSTLFAESAPSSGVGFLYRVNDNQSLTKIIGDIPGLMAVPNATGTYVAFSSTNAAGTALYILNVATGAITRSPIATLAEKCAWMPGKAILLFCGVPATLAGISIEGWFMGTQSFSDSAWIIDPVRSTAQSVRNLEKETGHAIDIFNPQVSPDGAYALFTNKNDLSLWSLSLTE